MSNLSSFLEPLEPRIAPAALTGSITIHDGEANAQVVKVELHPSDSVYRDGNFGPISPLPPNALHIVIINIIEGPPVGFVPLQVESLDLRTDAVKSAGFHRVKDFNAQFVQFAKRIGDLVKTGQPLPFSARPMDPDSPLNLQVDNLGSLI